MGAPVPMRPDHEAVSLKARKDVEVGVEHLLERRFTVREKEVHTVAAQGGLLGRRNLAATVELARMQRPRRTTWNDHDAATFLTAIVEDPLHPLYRMLLITGLRRGEALGLRWRSLTGGLSQQLAPDPLQRRIPHLCLSTESNRAVKYCVPPRAGRHAHPGLAASRRALAEMASGGRPRAGSCRRTRWRNGEELQVLGDAVRVPDEVSQALRSRGRHRCRCAPCARRPPPDNRAPPSQGREC